MCEAMYNVSLTNDADSLTEDTQLTVDCKSCMAIRYILL